MNKLTTQLDEVVNYLQTRKRAEITEISKKFNIKVDTLEKWFVILEKQKVVSIEYKGLKEYIVYAEKKKKTEEGEAITESNLNTESVNTNNIEETKGMFLHKAEKRGISKQQLQELWKKYIDNHVESLRKEFISKAKQKGIQDEQRARNLWKQYYNEIIKV